jgi:outer membrane protein
MPGSKTTLNSFATRLQMPSPSIDHNRVYDLSGLIDLAQRSNPETRGDWEAARAAAAKLGISEGAYLPTMSAVVTASNAQLPDYDRMGPFVVRTAVLTPLLRLDYVLIDFGRREAEVNSAAQALLATNLQFSRKQQTVTLAVQKAYFAFDASRARVKAREVALRAANAVRPTFIPERARAAHSGRARAAPRRGRDPALRAAHGECRLSGRTRVPPRLPVR